MTLPDQRVRSNICLLTPSSVLSTIIPDSNNGLCSRRVALLLLQVFNDKHELVV